MDPHQTTADPTEIPVEDFLLGEGQEWQTWSEERKALFAVMHYQGSDLEFCLSANNWKPDMRVMGCTLEQQIQRWGKADFAQHPARAEEKTEYAEMLTLEHAPLHRILLNHDGYWESKDPTTRIQAAWHLLNDRNFFQAMDVLGWDPDTSIDCSSLVVHAMREQRFKRLAELNRRGANMCVTTTSSVGLQHLFCLHGFTHQQRLEAYKKSYARELDLGRVNTFATGLRRMANLYFRDRDTDKTDKTQQQVPPAVRFILISDENLVRLIGDFVFVRRPWDCGKLENLRLEFDRVLKRKNSQKTFPL